MLSDRAKDAQDGIRQNIEAIADFTKDVTFQEFATDWQASRRLPYDLKARYPDTRWRAIEDAGNVYRHTYSKVSASIVWDTAVRQLDDLKKIMKQELPASMPPEPDTSRQHTIDESTKE